MDNPEERKGEIMILFEAMIWGLFPVITLIMYKYLDPLTTYAFVTLFAALFFGSIILFKKNFHELKDKKAIRYILIATILISILFYSFVYIGIRYTTAGNASIVLLMEILFSYLYFGIWHKEKYKRLHIIGAIMMAAGAIIILFPGKLHVNWGDLLILIGTLFPPIGNHFQQKARKRVSSEIALFVRVFIASVFMFIVVYFLNGLPSKENILSALPWLALSGILIFGFSKILWIEGIHRISVPKAISISTISPGFALIFAYLILKEIPTPWQISGLIPIVIGGYLITKK